MDCNDLAKIFAGEQEGDLEGSQDRAFTDHLSACQTCRDTLAGAEGQLDTLVDLVEPEPLPDAAWERVTHALRDELSAAPIVSIQRGARARRSPLPVLLAAAAAVLFLVGVAFLAQNTRAGLQAPEHGTVSHLELSTASAEATLVEAGEGYEAGAEAHGELLCLWVKETR